MLPKLQGPATSIDLWIFVLSEIRSSILRIKVAPAEWPTIILSSLNVQSLFEKIVSNQLSLSGFSEFGKSGTQTL